MATRASALHDGRNNDTAQCTSQCVCQPMVLDLDRIRGPQPVDVRLIPCLPCIGCPPQVRCAATVQMVKDTMSSRTAHWDSVYTTKSARDRSWTEDVPEESLRFIERAAVAVDDAIIDIGGGASFLVDSLLESGYRDVTVLDIAETALTETRERIAHSQSSSKVSFICADITQWKPEKTYAIWHDRAVFHFLTDRNDQTTYVALASASVKPGGHVLLAKFAPHGPESCSGLPVQRWSVEELAQLFADSFTLVESTTATHVTPWGGEQPFTWVLLRRK